MDENLEHEALLQVSNKAVLDYLAYMEDTESPRIFHAFGFLAAAAAALGRRVTLPFGHKHIYPNLYVALCGPPAVRKSGAIGEAQRCLRAWSWVRYAPDDTSGHKLGLINAMTDSGKDELEDLVKGVDLDSMQDLSNFTLTNMAAEDQHTLMVCASELSSLLTKNSQDVVAFLLKMYDAETYDYRTGQKGQVTLDDGLLTILGGTTPHAIQQNFPPELIGQGLTSRFIFVYSDEPYKEIPWREMKNQDESELVAPVFKRLGQMRGEMGKTNDAKEAFGILYKEKAKVKDPRFTHYNARRGTHIMKLAMVLCCLRDSMVLDACDFRDADILLSIAEIRMHEAFGEYGLTKESVAKQQILDLLKSITDPIPTLAMYHFMAKHMTQTNFKLAISDFIAQGRVTELNVPGMGNCLVYVPEKRSEPIVDLTKFDRLKVA